MIIITSFLFFTAVIFLSIVVISGVYYKLWWRPIHLQNVLRSQGLNGPAYKFIHGNTKEILQMRNQALKNPMDVSQHDMFPRILPYLYAWMNLYGNNFVYWIGDQVQIVITEPELIKEILANKEGLFVKIKETGHGKKLIGDGLLVAEGQKWSKLRKLANSAFHGDSLKEMTTDMIASVETMLDRWKHSAGTEIEVSNEFKILTSEVISRTAFGSSYEEGKSIFDTLVKLSSLIGRNAFKIRLLGRVVRSKDDIESDQVERLLRDSILALIRNREDNVKSGRADNFGSDYLGALLEIHHDKDPENRISVNDVIDECKIFYFAGHETTSSLLSWTILLLSVYPDWQDKAREEVVRLFGQETPTAESVARMKILPMIINETLRLYSPAVNITRQTHCKTKLGKYEIPAGAHLIVPQLAVHRNPDIWGQDAHTFNPDRFSEGLAKASKGNTPAFLPFGFGPRICVGMNFGANEAKIALSMILQRYKFTLSPNYVHSPAQIITINPQHGIQIVLQSL